MAAKKIKSTPQGLPKRHDRWLVYQATNLINGKRYVGVTGRYFCQRRNSHKQDAKAGKGYAIGRAIRLFGFKNFRFTILARLQSKEEMLALEVRLIAAWRPEYNITSGGDGSGPPPAWVFERFQNGAKGASERRKIPVICLSDGRIFGSGKEAADFYDLSPATICLILKGKLKSAKGMVFSRYTGVETVFDDPGAELMKIRETWRKNISISHIGNMPACCKAVRCLNDGCVFPSMKAAAENYGISRRMVGFIVSGVSKSRRGFRFEMAI